MHTETRIYLAQTKYHGAWHYVLLVDDQDTIDKFKELTQGENAGKNTIKLSDYGQVLKSGWGEEPPNDVIEWIENYEAP